MRKLKSRMIVRSPNRLVTFSATMTDLVLVSSLAILSLAVPPGVSIAARWARMS